MGVPTEDSGVQVGSEPVREVVLSTEAAAVFVAAVAAAVAAAAAAAGEEAVEASEERAGTDFGRTPATATSIIAK